jgi:hypothetical protein
MHSTESLTYYRECELGTITDDKSLPMFDLWQKDLSKCYMPDQGVNLVSVELFSSCFSPWTFDWHCLSLRTTSLLTMQWVPREVSGNGVSVVQSSYSTALWGQSAARLLGGSGLCQSKRFWWSHPIFQDSQHQGFPVLTNFHLPKALLRL